jgi:hypothetical protein
MTYAKTGASDDIRGHRCPRVKLASLFKNQPTDDSDDIPWLNIYISLSLSLSLFLSLSLSWKVSSLSSVGLFTNDSKMLVRGQLKNRVSSVVVTSQKTQINRVFLDKKRSRK